MAADRWPAIHAERKALIADLDKVTEEQWATKSLCAQWSVRDVLAHMTATAKMTPPRFIGKFAGAGFRFNGMTAKGITGELGASPADTLNRFKGELAATTHPPGPLDAMVCEAVVHGEDIRRPLGIAHTYSAEALTITGDFVTNSNLLLGGKGRAAGLTLRPNDVDWVKGTGPEVTGPMISILLALTGRAIGLEHLAGDGLATLKERVA